MIARCPLCKRRESLSADGKLTAHYSSAWGLHRCDGTGKTPAEIAIAQAEREVSLVREREQVFQRRIDDARAEIARAESELAALPAAIKKAEKKLASLRKKLAAKGGAQ